MASKAEMEDRKRNDDNPGAQRAAVSKGSPGPDVSSSAPSTKSHLNWREDGDGHWIAPISHGREARIDRGENGSFHARTLGGDPSATHMGTFPSLEAAQEAFSPDVNRKANSDEAKQDALDVRTQAAVSGDANRPEGDGA